ncbi:MAG TPA: DJ-1/PfpI family protein [Spirochaetia bacterium]|nr:DJ-1/PfpI family protein [Spirochaetia bacterium]
MRRLRGVVFLAVLALSPVSIGFSEPRAPRIVMVVAPTDFTDQEYGDPQAVSDTQGAFVRVASTSRRNAVSHDGKALHVDQALSETRLADFDALVIVGGAGAITYLMDNEAVVVSGRILTANGPGAAKDLALRVLETLKKG